MGGRKAIQDSDDESVVDTDNEGSPAPGEETSLSPVVNLNYSLPSKENSSGSSTEQIPRENEADNALPDPKSESSMHLSSARLDPSPGTSQTAKRRATSAFAEQNEKRLLKTYGSRSSQGVMIDYGHNDDEDIHGPRKRQKVQREEHPIHGESTSEVGGKDGEAVDDSTSNRVEAMLQQYDAAFATSTTSIGGLGSHLSFDTSETNATCTSTSKKLDVAQGSHSQPSTVPTLPTMSDSTSTDLTPAGNRDLDTSAHKSPVMATPEMHVHSSDEVIAQGSRAGNSSTRPGAVASGDQDGSRSSLDEIRDIRKDDDLCPLGLVVSVDAQDINVKGNDRLASSISKDPTCTKAGRLSETERQSQVETSTQADELGSDEHIHGLTKEQYQPRPSRSRSNRNDEDLLIPTDFSKRPEVASKKKKKSNRCKTTALAKPNPKVEVDDEDDEDPDPVPILFRRKDRPNADIEHVKKGLSEEPRIVLEVPNKGVVTGARMTPDPQQAQVEIAVQKLPKSDPPEQEKIEQAPPSSPQKKKRGRPRKKTTDAVTEVETTQAAAEEDEDLPNIQLPANINTIQRGRKKRKVDAAPPVDDESVSDKDEVNPHMSDNGTDAQVIDNEAPFQPKGPKGKKATGMQKTRKKRKADSPPPILEDSTSDSDEDTNPPPHREADPHLSQSEGNTRQKSTLTTSKVTSPDQVSSTKLTTPPKTPQKAPTVEKGPDKHSPLNSGKVAYRVGLSKRARIAPLLKIVKK